MTLFISRITFSSNYSDGHVFITFGADLEKNVENLIQALL